MIEPELRTHGGERLYRQREMESLVRLFVLAVCVASIMAFLLGLIIGIVTS